MVAASLDRRDIVEALLRRRGQSPWLVAPCWVCVYCGGGRDSLDCHISSHTAFREAGPASTSLSHAASCCGNVSLLAWLFDRYPADEASLRDVDATKDEVLCVCVCACVCVCVCACV
jgi:hypothetical protein